VLLDDTCVLLVVGVDASRSLRATLKVRLQLLFFHLGEYFGELTGPALKLRKVCRGIVFCLPDVLVGLLS
jgi:hypothetical protein